MQKGGPTEDTHGKSTLEQAGDTAAEALHALTDSLKDSSKHPQQRMAGSAAPPAQRAAGDYDKSASGGATGRPGAYNASVSLEGGGDPRSAGPYDESIVTHPASDAKSLGPYVVADVVDGGKLQYPHGDDTRRPVSDSGRNNLADAGMAAAEGVASSLGAVIPKANEGEEGNTGNGAVKKEDEPPQLGLRDPEGSYGAPKNNKPQAINLTQATRDAAKAADDKAAEFGDKFSAGTDQAATEAGKAGEWAQDKAGKASEAVQDGAEKTKGTASKLGCKAEEGLGRVKTAAEEGAERAGKSVAETVEATERNTHAAAGSAREYLEGAMDTVRGAMSDPLAGSGAGRTTQDELHDAAVHGQKVGEERRETLVEKAKELGSSVTNAFKSFGKSVANNAEDGADEEAGLTPHSKAGAARTEDRGHGLYDYVASVAERFTHSDDSSKDKANQAVEGTESALQKLQESLHNAGERIQEGITPTSQEDALLSQGDIPSNTQDLLTAEQGK